LLKGIALPLLVISAILSATSFSNKGVIEGIAVLGLLAGFIFLYHPAPAILRTSAFHLLTASAIAFSMTTSRKKIMEIVAAIIVIIGLAFLYQPFN